MVKRNFKCGNTTYKIKKSAIRPIRPIRSIKTKRRLCKSKCYTKKKITKYKIYRGGSTLEILKLGQMDTSSEYITKNVFLMNALENAEFSGLAKQLIGELTKIIKDVNKDHTSKDYTSKDYTSKVDSIILIILTLLYNQTITDPPCYVSHSLDHSIRVTVKMLELLLTLPELNYYMQHIYGYNTTLLVLFAGLLHDVGYSDLVYCFNGHKNDIHADVCGENKGIPSTKKFLHSISSQLMTKTAFDLKMLFDDKTINCLLDAIKYHNFDVITCQDNKKDSCSFKPTDQSHSLYIKGKDTIHREYIIADITVNPLLVALRIADNLDFKYSRLSKIQQDENLMLMQKSIFMNDKITNEDSKESIRKTEIKLPASFSLDAYTVDEKECLSVIIKSLKKNDFLHNYSNWIVEKTELIKKEDKIYLCIIFRKVQNDELNPRNPINYNASVYQITRCAESFGSIIFDTKNLTDIITVKLIYADGTIVESALKTFIM